MAIFGSNHLGWLEIAIDTDPIAHEPLTAFLFDLGCTGVVSEDFQDHTLKAYLAFPNDLDKIRTRIDTYLRDLEEISPEVKSPRLTFNKIQDQDWSRNWRSFFHTERVSPKLTVVPAWEPDPSPIEGHVIRIDPGPAFGTGKHATTRMCLESMEKVLLPESWTMLDVGTGSGILAMYGAILGTARVLAIDIDPEAIRWAERNIELNGLSQVIELSSRSLDQIKDRFNFVAANLILKEIIDLFPQFAGLLNPGAWLVLSGILRDQVKEVKGLLSKYGLREHKTLYQEEWACVICGKSNEE